MIFTLTPEAQEAYDWAVEKGICDDSLAELFVIILDQQVVSYTSEEGTVTFDFNDLVVKAGSDSSHYADILLEV